MVPEVGLEPTRPFGHQILSLARLPIPPLRHEGGRTRNVAREWGGGKLGEGGGGGFRIQESGVGIQELGGRMAGCSRWLMNRSG